MNPTDPVEITFLIPCYNKAENVTAALDTVKAIARDKNISYEVIVIDDGSTDDTSAMVKAYSGTNGQLPITLQQNPRNMGLGYNYLNGAVLGRGDYYLLINGDNDVPREDLEAIIESRGKADMIIPYVYPDTRPLFRRLVSQTFTRLVNGMGGHRLRYYNGPVLHRRKSVLRFRPKTTGFSYQAELLCRALRDGLTYTEIPYRSLAKKSFTSAFRFSNIVQVVGSLFRILVERVSPRSFD